APAAAFGRGQIPLQGCRQIIQPRPDGRQSPRSEKWSGRGVRAQPVGCAGRATVEPARRGAPGRPLAPGSLFLTGGGCKVWGEMVPRPSPPPEETVSRCPTCRLALAFLT